MSARFMTLVRQLDILVMLASGLLLLVLLYFWSVLKDGILGYEVNTVGATTEVLFQFAQHHVYRLEGGLIAQVQAGQLGYVFSQREWRWLNSLLWISQFLLYGVLLVCVWAVRYAALRRFSLSMAIMVGVLLYSPLFGLNDGNKIPSWWTLFLLLAPMISVYFDVRKRLPIVTGQRQALIAYASQTGSAKRLAEQLHTAAQSLADLRCVSQITTEQLHAYQRVFFVVSTHGNGEAPSSAHTLIAALRSAQTRQLDTHFSVLALGDRTYQTFCAFGYQLSDLLSEKGFKRELPTQAVDRMEEGVVVSWWQQVSGLLGLSSAPLSYDYDAFTVVENDCLNPTQVARLAYRLRLYLPDATYRAGDVLAVQPPVDSESTHERLYSIASYETGYVELLVRQHWRQDGRLGLASGYLTELQPGQRVKASIREHASFHLVDDVPLIMIGAGTGLAPFIGFLQQKQRWGSMTPNWLLFGEQYAEYDAYFSDTLQTFQEAGVLTRLDTAWSRSEGLYVQTLLQRYALEVREWVAQKGAHVYVCGSQQGFGAAVCTTLSDVMPEQYLSERLHTDLY